MGGDNAIFQVVGGIPPPGETLHYKFDLNIEYPPLYKWLVWDYKEAHIDNIKNSIKSVNWKSINNKTVNRQVAIFNETTINIFSNSVPNKLLHLMIVTLLA